MAFRRRGFRRPMRATRNSNMRVWTAVTDTDVDFFSGFVGTIADAAAFATTSGNTKHIGTLVRIRGHISINNTTANTATFSWGISLQDVGEQGTAASVNSSTYGRDEDVLAWEANRYAHGSSVAGNPVYIPIDIKAKRRMDVESTITLEMDTIAATGVLLAGFSLRCLFLVP